MSFNNSAAALAGRLRGKMALALLLFTLVSSSLVSGQADKLSEYQAKAALIYNFCKFTTWPSQAFEEKSSPLVIGILGKDPFKKAFDSIDGKMVGGRRLEIKRYKKLTDYRAGESHVLFCNSKDKESFKNDAALLRLGQSNTLTVGELAGFAEAGGIIEIGFKSDRLKLRINPAAAKRANVHLSMNLMKLAEIVSAEDPFEM